MVQELFSGGQAKFIETAKLYCCNIIHSSSTIFSNFLVNLKRHDEAASKPGILEIGLIFYFKIKCFIEFQEGVFENDEQWNDQKLNMAVMAWMAAVDAQDFFYPIWDVVKTIGIIKRFCKLVSENGVLNHFQGFHVHHRMSYSCQI